MHLFEELTEDNFALFAAKYYDNPQCTSVEEFDEDLCRFKYLKRLFFRYKHGDLQERLILNHIIIICNVFGIEPGVRMLRFKIRQEQWPVLNTFLTFLGYIKDTDVELDEAIAEVLQKI